MHHCMVNSSTKLCVWQSAHVLDKSKLHSLAHKVPYHLCLAMSRPWTWPLVSGYPVNSVWMNICHCRFIAEFVYFSNKIDQSHCCWKRLGMLSLGTLGPSTLGPAALGSRQLVLSVRSWDVRSWDVRSCDLDHGWKGPKGKLSVPNLMNFRKTSKRPLTPPPYFRKKMLRFCPGNRCP